MNAEAPSKASLKIFMLARKMIAFDDKEISMTTRRCNCLHEKLES
jgi:hypothetical protein